jgi:hypothetical protein
MHRAAVIPPRDAYLFMFDAERAIWAPRGPHIRPCCLKEFTRT